MVMVIRQSNSHPLRVNEAVARDSRLSWKSKGLYMYLASLGHNDIRTVGEIERASSRDGRWSTVSAIKPLIKYGYLTKVWYKHYRYMWILDPPKLNH